MKFWLRGEELPRELEDCKQQLVSSLVQDLAFVAAAEHDALISYAGASITYEPLSAPRSTGRPLGQFYESVLANVSAMAADAARGLETIEDADDDVADRAVHAILDVGDRDKGVALLEASLARQSEVLGLLVAYRAAARVSELVGPALEALASKLADVVLGDLRFRRGDDAHVRRVKIERLAHAFDIVHSARLTRHLDDFALLAKLGIIVQSHAQASRDARDNTDDTHRAADLEAETTRACAAIMAKARFYYSATAVRCPPAAFV